MSKQTNKPMCVTLQKMPRHTHLRDVIEQSPVKLVDSVAVQLRGVGDELDQVGHSFIPHVAPCLAEWESESNTRTKLHQLDSWSKYLGRPTFPPRHNDLT